MPRCAVANFRNFQGITNTSTDILSFHRFAKNENKRKVCITRCCRKDNFNVEEGRICSVHFADDCFDRDFKKGSFGLAYLSNLES